jgi:hypothetical protein
MKVLFFTLFNFITAVEGFCHGMSDSDKSAIIEAGYREYLILGANHMLTGYDHLLFLFGVMFFLTRFKEIVLFISAFTLGHCITLIFATLLGIQADYHLIDAVIALTVVYKGFDNLDGFKKWIGVNSPNLLGMVFAFGLIHGFGLSTRLQQLPLGESGLQLVLRILSFNVGVEIGQILALLVMAILLSSWRESSSFKVFGKVANAGLMFIGFLLFLFQLHGYQHSTYQDEFPLNQDDHAHVHEEMDAAALKQKEAEEKKSNSRGGIMKRQSTKKTHSHGTHSHSH